MVFCIIGLAIFGILGIFSAKYRTYAKEAWRCLKRQVTLRPCDTDFDKKMRAKAAGKFMKFPKLSRAIYKAFPAFSWAMVIMLFVSIYWTGVGLYNTVQYGNCNGPGSHEFCIFNPFESSDMHEKVSKMSPVAVSDDPSIGDPNSSVQIVEVGCFMCPYTKNSESIRQQLMIKYNGNVSFTFKAFALPKHNLSQETAEAALCAREQDAYWEYHDKLFEYQENMTMEKMSDIASELGLDESAFGECFSSRKYQAAVEQDRQESLDAGVFATPTYFVNGKPIVGMKGFTDFEQIVVNEIKGTCENA